MSGALMLAHIMVLQLRFLALEKCMWLGLHRDLLDLECFTLTPAIRAKPTRIQSELEASMRMFPVPIF